MPVRSPTDHAHYWSDGSGRDSYIHYNNGGLRRALGLSQSSPLESLDLRDFLHFHSSVHSHLNLPSLQLPPPPLPSAPKPKTTARRQMLISRYLSTPRAETARDISTAASASTTLPAISHSNDNLTRRNHAFAATVPVSYTIADKLRAVRARRRIEGEKIMKRLELEDSSEYQLVADLTFLTAGGKKKNKNISFGNQEKEVEQWQSALSVPV